MKPGLSFSCINRDLCIACPETVPVVLPVELRSVIVNARPWVRTRTLSHIRRRPMKSVLALAVSILLLICSASSPFKAQDREDQRQHEEYFNNASLNDRYGFHVLALSVDPSNPTTGASSPFAIAGYTYFHGDGTFDSKDTISSIGPNNRGHLKKGKFTYANDLGALHLNELPV